MEHWLKTFLFQKSRVYYALFLRVFFINVTTPQRMYILTEVSFGAMIAACAWRRSLMLLEQLERQNWTSNRISPSVWQLGFATPIKVLSADLLVPYFKYVFVFLSFLRSLFRPSCVEVVAYCSLAVVPLFSLFPCVCTFLGFPY